jgi:eukaryotic-like serine/threonine-protein kinase
MVEDMLNHLETTPGALPLLQFAAAKLWETRDVARRRLTRQSYIGMGGVAGALASHADRVVADLGAQRTGLVRALLLRLVTAERTRAIVPISELRELSREVGEIQRLIDQMVDARLLVVQTLEGGKGSTVEIVHESLLQAWPTLRRWLDENQDDAALVDQLRVAARQWQQKGFDSGLLWRGESASEAKKFRVRYKGPLSDVERGFLDAVVHFETAQARRRRAAIIGGFTFLSMIVVAAMVLLFIIQKSRAEAKDNLVKAEAAQREAQQNLEGMQKKESERLAEETEKRKIAAAKVVVDQKFDQSQEDLKMTNAELVKALDVATESAEQAKRSQHHAEENAKRAEKAEGEANVARDEAIKAGRALEIALKAERARVKELQDSIGGKPIEKLKPLNISDPGGTAHP